ncbi:hypothetical protein PFICI_00162 [Pestalotiopsis fici W106-1]|uniref:Uncharacterized protein n=1 Tax=Pestalotiopsis fici (strain W106-1 / CGMCC3.15140) TaxID=1229662 RepID=W3XJY5_PESFW|nr:uncharacterized protein PFICI_00162 [Pestalotiopsis fici W106-1]ETS86334.1 hypothetical protein PFICI_00162 [Pestalotiopsis fici W106-1]
MALPLRSPGLRAKIQLPPSVITRVGRASRSAAFYQSTARLRHRQERRPEILRLARTRCSFHSLTYRRDSAKVQSATNPQNTGELSTEGMVQWLLDNHGDAKWGWVIYRCTYKPELEDRWQQFKRLLEENIREDIAASDAPQIADSLDWPIIEDPELEGASHEALRRRWREWVRKEKPNVNTEDYAWDRSSRHTYFIQVDDEGLRSVLYDPHDPGDPNNQMRLNSGYVSLVKGWKNPLSPEEATNEFGDIEDNEDWMHICADMVAPYFYVEVDDPESWYTFYSPPPGGVCIW